MSKTGDWDSVALDRRAAESLLRRYREWLKSIYFWGAGLELAEIENFDDPYTYVIVDRVVAPAPPIEVVLAPGQEYRLTQTILHRIPLDLSRAGFHTHVYFALLLHAEHEVAEGFLVDGEKVFDPHDLDRFQTRLIAPTKDRAAFVCPACHTPSWNINDAKYGYCGRCRWWTGDRLLAGQRPC